MTTNLLCTVRTNETSKTILNCDINITTKEVILIIHLHFNYHVLGLFWLFLPLTVFITNKQQEGEKKNQTQTCQTINVLLRPQALFKYKVNSGARKGKQQPYDLSYLTDWILYHIWPKCPLWLVELGFTCEGGKLHIPLFYSLYCKPIHQLMPW